MSEEEASITSSVRTSTSTGRPRGRPPKSSSSTPSKRSRRTSRSRSQKLRKHLPIDNVKVEEPFVLYNESTTKSNHQSTSLSSPADTNTSHSEETSLVAGDACYVSATVHNKRYYGVLVDQAALQQATLLHFEHQATQRQLDQRLLQLMKEKANNRDNEKEEQPATETSDKIDTNTQGDLTNYHPLGEKRKSSNVKDTEPNQAANDGTGMATKRSKIHPTDESPQPMETPSSEITTTSPSPRVVPQNIVTTNDTSKARVQKFQCLFSPEAARTAMDSKDSSPARYELVATYANVHAAVDGEDMDPTVARQRRNDIQEACNTGGNFVGAYYYQYEPLEATLATKTQPDNGGIMRMSMGFDEFLLKTHLPPWFPLANLRHGQQAVLNILSMKRDRRGNLVFDEEAMVDSRRTSSSDGGGQFATENPLQESRSAYRVCVVGGGIAGLSACLEIFRACEREKISVEVVLLEGRSRLGGRLCTDRETFKTNSSTSFPVDLGASWIHGIDLNPLADLAREAGVDFIRTSEDVKMFKAGMEEVDPEKDKHAGELFDKLLDIAAETSWKVEDAATNPPTRRQKAIRWYSSVLGSGGTRGASPIATDVRRHRRSEDVSVDQAVGNAISSQEFAEFERLSEEERRMLFWNLKNVEYALGANMSDLSMKFWDIDERHAFEGDHVILRQGYSRVVDHLVDELQKRGGKFRYRLDFPVGHIEYGKNTGFQSYAGGSRGHQYVDLSETCCVTARDGSSSVHCDFVVCAVPLGVLKDSISNKDAKTRLSFSPPLPFVKRDAIESVGFGLLDKVYLQFPYPFWRTKRTGLGDEYTLFGNASGVNPHHYMFFDVGRTVDSSPGAPAILMSLVSGKEAVQCEWLSEEALIKQTLDTLRAIFTSTTIPEPIAYRATRWGSDEFSRGSYTFLPPGATDQDFQSLQSPINANGDSILLEGFETMRVFFAGEHTTALHPSMAHGAMLSGLRAAKEVISAMTLNFEDDSCDRLIPLSVFRYLNPKAGLRCNFCHVPGSRAYEGPLLAFKRGSRQLLAHNCCAEFSPEVEVSEGRWKHVIQAVNRSVAIDCEGCGLSGASIGCNEDECSKSYHFKCAEKTGWGFPEHGKEFFCDSHRDHLDLAPVDRENLDVENDNGDIQHSLFNLSGDSGGNDATSEIDFEEHAAVSDTDNYRSLGPLEAFDALGNFHETHLVRLNRSSLNDPWNLEFVADPMPESDKYILIVSAADFDDPFIEISDGVAVKSINGMTIGSSELDSMEKVIARLAQEVDIMLEIAPL